MPFNVGKITSRMARACTSGVTTGAGEYAPMPPVFGPRSPSWMRLWSCVEAKASAFLPSAITMKLASSPAMNSSITTRWPASPSGRRRACSRSPRGPPRDVVATTTPLPAASPSALITIGAPFSSTCACAAFAS